MNILKKQKICNKNKLTFSKLLKTDIVYITKYIKNNKRNFIIYEKKSIFTKIKQIMKYLNDNINNKYNTKNKEYTVLKDFNDNNSNYIKKNFFIKNNKSINLINSEKLKHISTNYSSNEIIEYKNSLYPKNDDLKSINIHQTLVPLIKDNEFGIVRAYDEDLDKGLEKFKSKCLLANKYNLDNNLLDNSTNNTVLNDLSYKIYNNQKKYYTLYKEEFKYNLKENEMFYNEVHYKINKINKCNYTYNDKTTIRDFNKFNYDLDNNIELTNPLNHPFAKPILKTIDNSFSNKNYNKENNTNRQDYTDNFYYLEKFTFENSIKLDANRYIDAESNFSDKRNFKHSRRFKRISEEIEEMLQSIILNNEFCPIESNNETYLFYLKNSLHLNAIINNINLNNIKPKERGNLKKILNLVSKNNDDINTLSSQKTFYNKSLFKEIFNLNDLDNLINLYPNDYNLIEHIKKIILHIEQDYENLYNSSNLIHDYVFNHDNTLLAIIFKSLTKPIGVFDIMIKDLNNNLMYPYIIKNSTGKVAFDFNKSIYYAKFNKNLRSDKIFRHFIEDSKKFYSKKSTLEFKNDILIYYEDNINYNLSVYNCNSYKYIYIELSKTNNHNNILNLLDNNYSNEIWFKPSDNKISDFTCIKRINIGYNYKVKYSSNKFFILINKIKHNFLEKFLFSISVTNNNNNNYYIEKPHNLKNNYQIDAKKDNNKNNCLVDNKIMILNNNLNDNEYINEIEKNSTSKIISNRNNYKFSQLYNKDKIKLIVTNYNIIDFEVFNNYLVTHEHFYDLNSYKKSEQIFTITNLNNLETIKHKPLYNLDTNLDLENYSNNLYFSIKLSDNKNFKSSYFRYTISNISNPKKTFDYSFGTNIVYNIHTEYFPYILSSLNKDVLKYQTDLDIDNLTTEEWLIPNRDNFTIPVILTYIKNSFDVQSSKYIFFIKGSDSKLDNMEFDAKKLILVKRGFVLVYPILRGLSNLYNNEWFNSGIKENKINNINDLVDVITYFKKINSININKNKIILYCYQTGSITGFHTVLKLNFLIDYCVFYDGIFDLLDNNLYFCDRNINLNSDYNNYYNNTNSISYLVKKEFGDIYKIEDNILFNISKLISPYHLDLKNYGVLYPTLVFACSKYNKILFNQNIKMLASLRNLNRENWIKESYISKSNANDNFEANNKFLQFDCFNLDFEAIIGDVSEVAYLYSIIIGDNIN